MFCINYIAENEVKLQNLGDARRTYMVLYRKSLFYCSVVKKPPNLSSAEGWNSMLDEVWKQRKFWGLKTLICHALGFLTLTHSHIWTVISYLSFSLSEPRSSVGITTGYGPGIESRRGRDFPQLSRLLHNEYRVFPEGKERPGSDDDLSPPSSAVVEKK